MPKYATRHRRFLVDFLAVVFGIGAWIAVNGIWVELPILVAELPEGWNLPSYLSVITQVANVGPIAYGILHRYFPRVVSETSTTFLMMSVGVVACLLLGLLWQWTAVINGEEHSIALFTLVFFVAIVDCTSSVVFLPFMGIFRNIYLLSYFIGEGLSGFLPSLVALVQGVGGNPECNKTLAFNETATTVIPEYISPPLFSVDVFFYFLMIMMAASFAAFVLLRYLPVAANEHVDSFNSKVDITSTLESSSSNEDSGVHETASIYDTSSEACTSSYGTDDQSDSDKLKSVPTPPLKQSTYFYLLSVQAWISFFQNGVLVSIQSYSCLPYGNLAYHLVVTLSNIANPIACFLAFFRPSQSTLILTLETCFGSVVGVYILVLAVLSPNPPLVHSEWGAVLMVVAWILFVGLVSHIKASLATVFLMKSKRALFWCGVVTQIGSAIGAILMFLLVNVYYLFKSYDPCIPS